MLKRLRNQRGAALIETAVTIPMVLLVSVSIFEFGRAYQTWQVLTNAAREGARVAVITEYTDAQVKTTVTDYLTAGKLKNPGSATVVINRNVVFGSTTASNVTVNYPFAFTVLNPVMKLIQKSSTTGSAPITMTSSALMRNEQ